MLAHSAESQFGQLRHSVAYFSTDLGEWLSCGLVELQCLHCGSPLFPARSDALMVQSPLREWAPGRADRQNDLSRLIANGSP